MAALGVAGAVKEEEKDDKALGALLSTVPAKSLVKSPLSRVPGAVKEEEKDDKAGILAKSLVKSLLPQDQLDLKKSKNHQLLFFQTESGGSLFQSLDMEDASASRKFNSPVDMVCEVKGSANGLICLAPYYKGGCFIWNPCTGETKKIPVPIPRASSSIFGFGYDSCSDDYKILAGWGKHFRVFSLKTNSWKVREHPFLMRDPGFHLNGSLHWFCYKTIRAFDLATESIYSIELPDEMKPWTLCERMWEYQGLLCLSAKNSIWMMKKYPDGKSWVKLSQFLEFPIKPLGISRLGEVVYQGKNEFGVVKSDNQGRMSDYAWFHMNEIPKPGFVYKESLISPTCFDALHPQPADKMIERPGKQRKITAA